MVCDLYFSKSVKKTKLSCLSETQIKWAFCFPLVLILATGAERLAGGQEPCVLASRGRCGRRAQPLCLREAGLRGRLPRVCRCWVGRRCSRRTEDGFAPAAAGGARRGARRGAGGRSPDTGEKGLGTDAGLGSLLFWRQGPRRALLLTADSSTCPFSPCFP